MGGGLHRGRDPKERQALEDAHVGKSTLDLTGMPAVEAKGTISS